MELYMDEKWKLAKKGSRNSASRRVSASAAATAGDSGGATFLKRSASLPGAKARAVSGGGGPPSSFTSRCASLVKEQRARFYIMRRCVTMLICWRDYS